MDFNKRIITYAVIILATLALAFGVTPLQIKKIYALNKNIQKLREDGNKINDAAHSRPQIIASTAKVKAAIAQARSKIIAYRDISSLQTYIVAKAKENQLDVLETGSVPGQKYKKIGDTQLLNAPLNLSLRGNFHNLAKFIAVLEKGEYSLKVQSMIINGGKPPPVIGLGIMALVKEQ